MNSTCDLAQVMLDMMPECAITPHIFFECLVPVARGARPASIVFFDQFNRWKMNEQWYSDISQAVQKHLGLKADLLIDADCPDLPCPKVVFYKSEETGMDLSLINAIYLDMLSDKMSGASGKNQYFNGKYLEGKLAGIPECCIEKFIEGRRNGYSPEQRIMDRLRERVMDVDDIGLLPLDMLVTFWALEIYPCSLDCEHAGKKGYEILNCFEEQPCAELYKDIIMVNNAKALHTRNSVIVSPAGAIFSDDIYGRYNKAISDHLFMRTDAKTRFTSSTGSGRYFQGNF